MDLSIYPFPSLEYYSSLIATDATSRPNQSRFKQIMKSKQAYKKPKRRKSLTQKAGGNWRARKKYHATN